MSKGIPRNAERVTVPDGYPFSIGRDVRAGTERGLTRFRAEVLGENHRMLRLLAHRTCILERSAEQGVVSVVFAPR